MAEIRCGIPRVDRNIENRYGTFLDWHPDGQWLAASEYNADYSSASENQGILLISISDGTTRQLTAPPPCRRYFSRIPRRWALPCLCTPQQLRRESALRNQPE